MVVHNETASIAGCYCISGRHQHRVLLQVFHRLTQSTVIDTTKCMHCGVITLMGQLVIEFTPSTGDTFVIMKLNQLHG